MSETQSPIWDLADLFPAPDAARWRQQAEAALKGAPFERLIAKSYDGISIQPLYAPQPHQSPRAVRQNGGAWAPLARLDLPNADQAHVQGLADLDGGAQGLHLVFADAPVAYGFGLSPKRRDVAYVLEEVYLNQLPIVLDCGPHFRDVGDEVIAQAQSRHIDPSQLNIDFGLDPYGSALTTGAGLEARAIDAVLDYGCALIKQGITSPIFVADGRVAHNAGASEGQELAFALSAAVALLRHLEAKGMALTQALAHISFRLSADADQFLSIAKMRALRLLWARVEKACGLPARAVRLHADTSWRMMTRRDPWVNLLRTSVAAFSAGLGGADNVSVLPFTQALGLPDGFARRMARNTQSILMMEAHLAHVADPAAGAGGFETLTDDLCRDAWALFQTIEAQGGFEAAYQSGALASYVAKTCSERARHIAQRKNTLTGTSDFPNITESAVEVLAPLAPQSAPASSLALAPHRVANPLRPCVIMPMPLARAINAPQKSFWLILVLWRHLRHAPLLPKTFSKQAA